MLNIVLGDEAGNALRARGTTNILVVRDLLSVGPSDVDPVKHRALRIAQWKLDESEARAGNFDLTIPPDQSIALWTAPKWPSRLFEWHTVAQLARQGIDPSRVSRVELTARNEVHIASLEDETANAAIELWTRFCASSPLSFDEARLHGFAAYPDLARVAEGWGAWFPRADGTTLRLSWADQQIFENTQDVVRVLVPQIGDSNVEARKNDWVRHGALDATHALTPLGLRLRDDGTRNVADLAPLALGGCRINDPKNPWVRSELDGGWHLRAG